MIPDDTEAELFEMQRQGDTATNWMWGIAFITLLVGVIGGTVVAVFS